MSQSDKISSIVNRITGNPILIGVILYIIIFIVPFSFLRTFEFGDWKYTPFVQSMITTFMGGGTIAIITAGLLVFQKTLDSEHKRKEEVFTKRVQVYHNVIQTITPKFVDGILSKKDIQEIESLYYELALVASTNVQQEYLEFLQGLKVGKIENIDLVREKVFDIIDDMSESLGMGEVEILAGANTKPKKDVDTDLRSQVFSLSNEDQESISETLDEIGNSEDSQNT